MSKQKNIFLGFLLIAAAGLILFKDSLPNLALPIWKILLGIFLAVESVQNLFRKKFLASYVGAALTFVVLNSEYHWLPAGTWTLLIVVVLSTFGLKLIFQPKGRAMSFCISDEGGKIHGFDKVFGSSTQYINDDDFTKGYVDMAFGTTTIYFDNATMAGDKATFTVDVAFGNVTLYIPRDWMVDVQVDNAFSIVDCQPSMAGAEKTLQVRGDVSFAGLRVLYV